MLLIIFLLAIFSIVLIHLLLFLPYRSKNEPLHLPPGPKGLPVIGNLHQFDPSQPQVYFAKIAKTYGPILSLQLGRLPVVVVQSAKLAKEVLRTQDTIFCSRPALVGMQKLSYNGFDIAFCPYNEYFREIKKISVVHLFSSRRVESFAPILQEEMSRMIQQISSLSSTSQVVNLSDVMVRYACSNICRIAFGKRYEDAEGSKSKFHSLIHEAEALLTGAFYSDYLPCFGWLDYLSGQTSALDKIYKDLDAFYDEIIHDHLNPLNMSKSDAEHIIDVLINLDSKRQFQLTSDQIKAVLMDIFLAGTETTSSTIIWAMTELVKNPNSMKKVQEELRNIVQNKDYIEKDDLIELEYFKAVKM